MWQRELIGQPEADDNAQDKDADIQKEIICAENRSVGIVKKRDENRARYYAEEQRGSDMGVLPPVFQNHNEGIEQHGKEQQLHMFPDGLVNRCEKTDNGILPRPVI